MQPWSLDRIVVYTSALLLVIVDVIYLFSAMTHILLVILIDIMLCVYGTHSVTLNEGRKDPNKYILYDTSDFNIPLHAGIALLQSYVILAIVIGSVFLVGKLTGR